MNYEEIENRKKVSKEMEEKLLKTMKQKHLKRLSVAQYINDMQLTGKEKACLLGSMKNFEQLRRTYTYSPSKIMKIIKGKTSRVIRQEFEHLSKMPSVWTRSYFVSTAGNVSSEIIKRYVENQRTRY